MSADAGADHRTMLALQERMDRADAEAAKIQGMLKALGNRVVALESAGPSPASEPVDPAMPSRAERDAMRERLRARTLAGIEANKADPTRAGRTFRRDVS